MGRVRRAKHEANDFIVYSQTATQALFGNPRVDRPIPRTSTACPERFTYKYQACLSDSLRIPLVSHFWPPVLSSFSLPVLSPSYCPLLRYPLVPYGRMSKKKHWRLGCAVFGLGRTSGTFDCPVEFRYCANHTINRTSSNSPCAISLLERTSITTSLAIPLLHYHYYYPYPSIPRSCVQRENGAIIQWPDDQAASDAGRCIQRHARCSFFVVNYELFPDQIEAGSDPVHVPSNPVCTTPHIRAIRAQWTRGSSQCSSSSLPDFMLGTVMKMAISNIGLRGCIWAVGGVSPRSCRECQTGIACSSAPQCTLKYDGL